MKIDHCHKGQVLVQTTKDGTSYFRVVKVNRVTIDVECEDGHIARAYPHVFDREASRALMPDEVRKMFAVKDAALQEISSQCHNLPRSATADRINLLAQKALAENRN